MLQKTNKKKIIICSSEFPPSDSSGIGNVVYYLAEVFKESDLDCKVCSPNGPDIKLGSSKLIKFLGAVGVLYYWICVSIYFKKNDYDWAWLHNPLFILNNPFKKSIGTFHSTYYGFKEYGLSPRFYYKMASLIEKYSLNKTKNINIFVGVSLKVCEELNKILKNKDIRYISNGVDTAEFRPINDRISLRRKFDLPECGIILLSVGRLTDAKRPFTLLELFSLLEDQIEGLYLVLAGNGELLNKAIDLSLEMEIKGIKFLGQVQHSELASLYACCDYYIITSSYEGLPLTLLEALSSGLPCIVSNIPSLVFVEEKNAGIIVDLNDLEIATQKISNFISKKDSIFSNNARMLAINSLDWSSICSNYIKLFRDN